MPSELIRERRARPARVFLVVAVVLLAAAALAASRRPWLDRLRDALRGDAARVAQALAAKLRAEDPGLEPIHVSGREVRLLDGRVRLLVRSETDEAAVGKSAHLHVAAVLAESAATGLDACIHGFGEDHGEALAQVAELYRTWALPPILAIANAGSSDAVPFGGSEASGVPGFRGFAGPLGQRGEVPRSIAEALQRTNLFAGLALPEDGRAHLAKVVMLAKDGRWERSIEVDGVGAAIRAQAWTGAPAPPELAYVVRFAAFRKRDRLERQDARADALRRIVAGEADILARGRCPLPFLPPRLGGGGYVEGLCGGGRLLDCVEECDAGSATACYHAATEVQSDPSTEPRAFALFLRACRLGYASGCTNAAATLDAHPALLPGSDVEGCTGPTYEAVCERSGDPWGCTMLGAALLDGRGVARDAARARAALEKACSEDPEDPACVASRGRLAQLDASGGRPK